MTKKRKETLQGLIPPVNTILDEPDLADPLNRLDREFVVAQVRHVLNRFRTQLKKGREKPFPPAEIAKAAAERIAGLIQPGMHRVINATGTIIHTGLGRAVMPPKVRAALNDALTGYCWLQTEQDDLSRTIRERFIIQLCCELTGAETAVVTNNNAAAVFLLLKAAAAGREVVISRGELVEIGGSFRIPDVMRQADVKLVEVGTTNRTKVSDYEAAITENTGALMVVHQSNYRIEGFTAAPPIEELAALAHKHGLLLIHDLGSGTMTDLSQAIPCQEPLVRDSLDAGSDIVSFSGDKVLGGVQAGIILGKKELLEPMRKDPFFRILRPCKMTLIALEGLFSLYAQKAEQFIRDIPVLAMFFHPLDEIRSAAQDLAATVNAIEGFKAEVIDEFSASGGGALPGVKIPTVALAVTHAGTKAKDLSHKLRTQPQTPVLVRISEEQIILDPRTLLDGELEQVKNAFLELKGS